MIYEWLYNNIDWEPGWGLNNGAFGTLLAGRGNAFDQSCLLITMLRAAGYTANYVLGKIQLNAAAAGAWFGTDPSFSNESYAFYNEIPVAYVLNSGTGQYDIQMSHVWVQCVIGATTYVFDPSYKTYARKSALANLGTILGYNASTFLSSAESGATIDPSGNFVQNMNDTNIRSNLATMAGNLATYIKTNMPTAGIDDILGGASIVPVTLPVLNTSLPYEVVGDTPTIWTGNVPLAYQTTFRFFWTEATIDQTFTSDQLAGARLTVFWSATTPTLYLNGTAVQVGTAVIYSTTYPNFQITHNAYTTFGENEGGYRYLNTGENALVGTVWCAQGRGPADYHAQQVSINSAAGGADASESVLGESLATLWATWLGENFAINDLIGRFNHSKYSIYHGMSMVAYTGDRPRIDIATMNGTGVGLDSAAPSNTNRGSSGASILTNCVERAMFQQICGIVPSVNASKIMQAANTAGHKIYKATTSDWSSTVSPALTANGYTSAQLTDIYNNYVNNGYQVELPDHPNEAIGDLTAYGFYAWNISNNGGPVGNIYTMKGGVGGGPSTPTQIKTGVENNQPNPVQIKPPSTVSNEPIDLFTGNYTYARQDISVGSQPFPYGLDFTRNYNSANQYVDGPLGRGWTHNYAITATVNSDAYAALGQQYALPAVASIVAIFVMQDLCTTTVLSDLPLDKHVVTYLASCWWVDQACQNTVVIKLPEGSQVFTKLPDGSYAPPLNNATN